MSKEKDNKISTYDGHKFRLEGQSVQEYEDWRNRLLKEFGQELASNFPKMYGSISFNMQNGKFVNWNMNLGGR